ncbi:RICIN domain-containing protein [Streptomyces longwoodensis]|uniref:RICIN domain-containing protein n=1 Tax=Streptomyces longwoodensis TaxID=68231 RepID=UPI0033E1879C
MKDAGLSVSTTSARRFAATDEQLSAELKNWTGASPAVHPVGELLDRHWEAAFAYARLCTDGERAAGMLTTAAFTRVFGESMRQDGPTAAWRPHLLVTVRRIAAEWDGDGRRELLHPDLRAADGDGERLAARLLPPLHRRLLSRAYQRLPQTARCLLWHTEVEAEPTSVPAALLGLDDEGALVELRRSRERLREECLQLHRELAVDEDCHRYHRLLDVTCRRGGADVDPDLSAHLRHCRHCAHTADQLRHCADGLGLALAEGVLGWGARAYLTSRITLPEPQPDDPVASGTPAPPHAAAAQDPAPPAGEAFTTGLAAPTAGTGRTRSAGSTAPPPRPRSVRKAARRARRRHLAVAALTVTGLIALPLVVWSLLGTDDGAGRGPGPDSSAGTGTGTAGPSWAGAGESAAGTLRGRLHNVASGLCVGILGGKAASGAETGLAPCSSAAGQQWAYEPDGLLRNGAAPSLCLDSRLGYSVRLTPCASTGADARALRHDFTLQGTLVPRWNQDLALTPAATDGSGTLVAKNRADSSVQRWVIDTSRPDPQLQTVGWGADGGTGPSASPTPKAARPPAPARSTTPPARTPAPSASAAPGCSYATWYACSGGDHGPDGRHDGSGGYGGHDGYDRGGSGYGRR